MLDKQTYLTPFAIAALLSLGATIYQLMDGPHAELLAGEFINREIHVPAASLFAAFLGLMLVAATPKACTLRTLFAELSPKAFGAFATTFGAMAGWWLTISIVSLFSVEPAGRGEAIELVALAVLLAVLPYFGYSAIGSIFQENTGLMFRERKAEFARVVLGTALCVYGLGFFTVWFKFA